MIREFFIACFLMFLKSLPALLSYQSLIQGNKPPLLSVHSIRRMLPKMPPSNSLFIFLWLKNSASSNSLCGTRICCRRNTLAKLLCHLMIGSSISRMGSKGHLVLINQATQSVMYPDLSLPSSYSPFGSRSPSPLSLRELVLLQLVASRLSWASFPLPMLRICLNLMKYSPSSLNAHDRRWSPLLL